MKRAPALVPLSREHHEALVLARRACEPWRPQARPDALRSHLLQRWDAQFEPHFAREEAHLFPALRSVGEEVGVLEAHRQHDVLREAIARLRAGDLDALPSWGEAMREHVRWEERELFPLAERLLDLPALQAQLDTAATDPECKP
jgi:hypothetical protein